MRDEHHLAPTHVTPPDAVPEGPPAAAPVAGRPIGVPVGIRTATFLCSQDSNQDLAAHITHIIQDTTLLKELVWHQFVAQRR